jgi:HEAT repeat protein
MRELQYFRKRLLKQEVSWQGINSIWGISQLARKDIKYGDILLSFLQDSDPEIKAQTAKWIGDIKFKKAGDKLLPLLKDANSRCRFFAAEALGRLMYEPAIGPIVELLQSNNDEDAYIRHAGSLALARIGKAAPVVALSKNASPAVRIAAVVALRRMGDPGIAAFLNDTDEAVVTEAARGINDDLSIPDALPALGKLLVNTPFKNEALIRRSINANLRVGTDEALQMLINYSIKESNPAAMRAEAIETISTWANPSVLDRVDGRYRGVVHRNEEALNNKAGDLLIQSLGSKEMAVRIAAVKAVSKLKIPAASAKLTGLLKNDPQPSVRVEALNALAAIQDKQIGDAIKQAIADKDKTVRIAGLGLMQKMNIPTELMVNLLSDVINNRTPEEQQAALLTLGNYR